MLLLSTIWLIFSLHTNPLKVCKNSTQGSPYTYFQWEHLAHSRLPRRHDSCLPWLVRMYGTHGYKLYFGDFQVLGWQPGNEISCTVSLRNRESTAGMVKAVFCPFYALLGCFYHIHAIYSCQPGKVWFGVNHAFTIGANELNALTKSMYRMHMHQQLQMCMHYFVCNLDWSMPLPFLYYELSYMQTMSALSHNLIH